MTPRSPNLSVLALCLLCSAVMAAASVPPSIPHLRKQGNSTQLVINGQPFLMLAGELHNSSSTGEQYMREAFPRLKSLNLNTVLAAIPWELIEPEEGKFDFALVDSLIDQARQHQVKLVFLWFGSWKNGTSSYVPGWVKKDTRRFIRGLGSANQNVKDVLAPDIEANWTADARAFAALMRHIRSVDAHHHTVITMQVQNEIGFHPEARDQSPRATALFNGTVPAPLMEYLKNNKETLIPEFRAHWEKAGFRTAGTWTEVFSEGLQADEAFSAWHYATYVNRVAAAGKAEYPLPMYVNAWLRAPNGKPGNYPSGGPVANVMDIYHAAAPAIDYLAPDIYLGTFKEVCAEYTQKNNPLMIPEASTDPQAIARAFWAFAQHDALCFAPFGIDHVAPDHPLVAGYHVLHQLMPLITAAHGTGRMIGIYQQDRSQDQPSPMRVGNWRAHVRYANTSPIKDVPPFGLIIQTAEDELVIAGNGFDVNFSPVEGRHRHTGILSVDLVRVEDGKFIREMSLNGDETGAHHRAKLPIMQNPYLDPAQPRILRVKLYHFD